MKRKLSVAERREENWGWIMVAPTIIGLFVLNIWPFIQTIDRKSTRLNSSHR